MSALLAAAPGHIPLGAKLALTLFVAVLVPAYLRHYGPTNFLYFCDIALLLTLAGCWTESALLISMCAVGIIGSQLLWNVDFLVRLCGGRLTGMTDYMFDARHSLFLRGLSLFHAWLPFLLLYLVWRLGYDGRGLWLWTALAFALVLVSFFFLPPPRPDAAVLPTPVNIDYAWGLSDTRAQRFMPQWLYLPVYLATLFFVLYLPAHLLLQRYAPPAR